MSQYKNHAKSQKCYHREDREHIIISSIQLDLNVCIIEYISNPALFIGEPLKMGACSASELNTDANLFMINPTYQFSLIDTTDMLQPRIINRYVLAERGFRCYVAKDKFNNLFDLCYDNVSMYLRLESMLTSEKLI